MTDASKITKAVLALGLVGLAATLAAAHTGHSTEFAVYRGPGCVGRDRIKTFEALVGRKVERTVDALNQSNWKEMRSSIPWVIRCWKDTGVKLTLSVPMLPFDKDGTLKEGTEGRYDDIFKDTARHLVQNGFSDAVVRIAWEFNGAWMPWRADRDPESYKAYFRRIVGLMRAEPGQTFRFEWTPNHGRQAMDASLAYPGDDVVDIIGMDVYDEIWSGDATDPATRWTSYVERPFGFRWHRDFARQHGKPTAYSEWGIGQKPGDHGGGDNPYFVAQMAQWIVETGPLYQSYFDVKSSTYDSDLSSGRYPDALAQFKRSFGSEAKDAGRPH